MMRTFPTRPGACALILVTFLTAARCACAQFRWPRRSTEYFISQVQVAGSRAADQQLAKAKKDLENGEFDRCVRLVQGVLDKHAARALSTESGRFIGIRDFCNRFIRELPEKGFETYRKIFDPYAKELYDRGVDDHDAEPLKQVYLRYINTSYGKRSLVAASSMLLERGDFHELVNVSLLFLEIYPGDEEYEPSIQAALALGARMLGDHERLERLAGDLDAERLATRVRVAGREVGLGDFLGQCLEEIRHTGREPVSPPSPRIFNNPQWNLAFPMQGWRGKQTSVLDDFGRTAAPTQFGWNPVEPVVDEGCVYVSNGLSVRAVGLYSRDDKWTCAGPVSRSQARRNLAVSFPLLLDRNVIYTSLESPVAPERRIWSFVPQHPVPHRQLYAIDASSGQVIWRHYRWMGGTSVEEADFVESLNINSRPLVIGENLYVAATKFHTSYHHYLCCFDRRTGALRWSTFICTGQMEQNMFGNRVREAIAGHLAEKDGIIFYSTNIGVIAAVDVRLGTLRFTVEYQQIEIPRQTRFDTNIHERSPAWANNPPIIIGDEVFVAPMDCQDLLAVNRHNGRVRRLGIRRDEKNRYEYVVGPYNDTIVVAGSRILFYDAASGKKSEPSYNGLGGSRRRSASRRLGVQGRPLILGDRLFAPVRRRGGDAHVYVWDLDRLKLVDEIGITAGPRSARLVGNLAGNAEVLVMAATDAPARRSTQITCYFDRGAIRTRLDQAMGERPLDPRPHFRAGEFALQGASKDYRTALESFEHARELAEQGPVSQRIWAERSRDSLYRLYLELARRPRLADVSVGLTDLQCYERALDVARSRGEKLDILFHLVKRSIDQDDWTDFQRYGRRIVDEHADEPYDYRNLFRREAPDLTPSRRYPAGLVATVVRAAWAEKQGQHADALSAYQKLLASWPAEFVGRDTAWMYAYRHVEELIRTRGAAVYARQEREAADLLARARATQDSTLFRRVLDNYPNSSRVPAAYLEISQRHLAEGRHHEAVRTIHEYLAKFGRASVTVLYHLALALENQGCHDSAGQVWRHLAAVATDETVTTPDGGVGVREFAEARISDSPAVDRKSRYRLPSLGLSVGESWKRGQEGEPDDWVLVFPRGQAPEALTGAVLAHKGDRLHCLSAARGETLWSVPCRQTPGSSLAWFDGCLVGLLDGELVCVKARDGSEIWRSSLGEEDASAISCGQGKVYVLLANGYSPSFRLQARGILDGEVVFDSSFEGVPCNSSDGVQVSDRWVMVAMDTPNACIVLDAYTGRPAPGFPDGFSYGDDPTPILTADGMVVSVSSASRRDDRQLYACDPATGRTKWSRRLGAGDVRYISSDPYSMIYKLRAGRETTLVVVDLVRGTALLRRPLGDAPDEIDTNDVQLGDDRVVTVCRRSKRPRGLVYFCEEVDLSTSSTRWRTLNFSNITMIRALPFREGLLMTVIERIRRSGRRTYRKKTTLYLVDGQGGRVRQDIELADLSPRFYPDIATVADGHLIVVDGPIIKGYQAQ